MDATWSRPGNGSEWRAAVDLANRVAAAGGLPGIPSPVLLDAGEVLHGDFWRSCRFRGSVT